MNDTKQTFNFSYKEANEEVKFEVTFDNGGTTSYYEVFQKFLGFLSIAYGYSITEKDLMEHHEELE